MTNSSRWYGKLALAIIAASLGVACAVSPESASDGDPSAGADSSDSEDSAEGPTDEVTSPLYATPNAFWPKGTDGVSRVPVCWTTAGYATEKGWVRSTVESQWASITALKFSGWGDCSALPATTTAIRIRISDVRPESSVGPKAASTNMWLNFMFARWVPTGASCATSDREFCIRFYGLHEFGHALGFRHEQDAPGSTCTEGVDPTYQTGGQTLTLYDKDSIMNYCADWRTTISSSDRAGLKLVYPCVSGKTYCGSTCTTTNTKTNCGACGKSCPGLQTCSTSTRTCVGAVCASGQLFCSKTKTCMTSATYARICR